MPYGHDPRLPAEAALIPAKARSQVDLCEYGIYITEKLAEAWDLARTRIKRAQKKQKLEYDQYARATNFSVGEQMFLLKPAENTELKLTMDLTELLNWETTRLISKEWIGQNQIYRW